MQHVYYIPPATGFRVSMDQELEVVRNCEGEASIVDLSRSLTPFTNLARGLSCPKGEVDWWRAQLAALGTAIGQDGKVSLDTVPAANAVTLVGFNLGGSIAAHYAVKGRISSLIVSGTVPRLSTFWTKSRHPIAIRVREAAGSIDPCYEVMVRPFDFVESLKRLRIPVLVQLGRADDWILPEQAEVIMSLRLPNVTCQWYEDDHDMMSPDCQRDRIRFLNGEFNGSKI